MRKQIAKALLLLAFVFGMASCATRGSANSWEDSAIIARQRAEIEQLQRDIADLRSQLGNAQQITQSSIGSIDRAYTRLESSLAGASDIQSSIDAITEFARQCLTEIERIKSYQPENNGSQPADRRTDAGAR